MTTLQVADLVVGLVTAGNGLVVLRSHRGRRVGLLLIAVSVTWFVGDLLPGALFLHRGPMIQLHLSYPTGRLRRAAARVAVLGGYVWALVDGWVDLPALTAGVAAVVALAAVDTFAQTAGPARRAGAPALVAALAFAGILALSATNRLLHWEADYAVALGYDGVVVAVTTWLTVDLLRGRWTEQTLAELMAQLSGGGGDLQAALRRAVGDPTLVVGPPGTTVEVAGRMTTPVVDGGAVVAVLVHGPELTGDAVLLAGAVEAARLGVVNERLRVDLAARAETLVAARRRLLDVGEEQRRRLQQLIADGPLRDLEAADAALDDGGRAAGVRAGIAAATVQLDAFASGLRPAGNGLRPALEELVRRVPIPVRLSVRDTDDESTPATETAWFVCSESLANAVKHADATTLAVDVRRLTDHIEVNVVDDGRGGADPSGSGLLGLADRVAAHGGRLSVQSPRGTGTTVAATIPTGPAAS